MKLLQNLPNAALCFALSFSRIGLLFLDSFLCSSLCFLWDSKPSSPSTLETTMSERDFAKDICCAQGEKKKGIRRGRAGGGVSYVILRTLLMARHIRTAQKED